MITFVFFPLMWFNATDTLVALRSHGWCWFDHAAYVLVVPRATEARVADRGLHAGHLEIALKLISHL